MCFQIECIQMSAREATTMGDILAAEANILGMIKEVNFKMHSFENTYRKQF